MNKIKKVAAIISVVVLTSAAPITAKASALAMESQTRMNLFNPYGYEYKSSNTRIVKVIKKNGLIKAVKPGTCKIKMYMKCKYIGCISVKVIK